MHYSLQINTLNTLCCSQTCPALHSPSLQYPYFITPIGKAYFTPSGQNQMRGEYFFKFRNICLLWRNYDCYNTLCKPSKCRQMRVNSHTVHWCIFSFGQCCFMMLWRLGTRWTPCLSCVTFGQRVTWSSVFQQIKEKNNKLPSKERNCHSTHLL